MGGRRQRRSNCACCVLQSAGGVEKTEVSVTVFYLCTHLRFDVSADILTVDEQGNSKVLQRNVPRRVWEREVTVSEVIFVI